MGSNETTGCRKCWAAIARAQRENPGSFNHGIKCDACRAKDVASQLEHMRAMWRDLRDQLSKIDRSTRSGESLAKDFEARMARVVVAANQLKQWAKETAQ